MIAVLEPFSDNTQINLFKSLLVMDHAISNINGKIWLFWTNEITCNVIEADEQQISCELNHTEAPETYITTFVYAKCKEYLRKPLWDRLLHLADTKDTFPWCTVGDFNVITDIDEKLGGIPYNMRKSLDFIGVIEACGLMDLGFNGPRFTWSNQRGINFRIWKRLDRAMVNDRWLKDMPQTNITHLPSVGSDHCPLLMEMNARPDNHIKYFRFLNCWADQPSFTETVTDCWKRPIEGNPMWTFHQKMKRLAATLSVWSKMQIGDNYAKVKDFEARVKEAEDNLIHNNTEEQRSKLHGINAEYIRFMKMEDSILKQKTQLHWFREGDSNSKYFHALIRGRRRRLFIHKILNDNADWVQGDEQIAKAACEHFQNIFTGEEKFIDEIPMNCIPRMVDQVQNDRMKELPTMEELKEVVYSMNPNSAAGPDGMNGYFFQKCWSIIKKDLLAVIHAFFSGQMLPKYFSHACLVLLPKVKNPNKLTEFRPISLSNFTNKIISKLLCLRLTPILPSLISSNQSGFVKGRSISENIMLAQEIIHQLKQPNIGSNVVIKLDMAKAYDRVSWSYICLVLRRMGFDEVFIDMVWRIMANNWYSIIINGKRHGFFHSTRGLKQGDPLSPALFILGAEVLSRSLNRLFQNPLYHGFHMERRGPQINHLSFADDIIIFTSGRKHSLKLIMHTLATYERISGQLVNKAKSHFMLHSNAFRTTSDRVRKYTGFHQKDAPLTYLGCPLFVGRPRIIYFSELINKVVNKITGWQSKLLSFGGKATLIKHVLQSLPIHILATTSTPSTVMKQIQGTMADFFWGWRNDKKKYHWSSWKNLSFPYDEGGIGVRLMSDVCRAFQFKQWWTFRSKQTLWGDFLRAKYCQRSNPISKKWDTGESQAWRLMMKNKHVVESHIQWKIRNGSCSFWWDNWLGVGPLAQYTTASNRFNNEPVSDFIEEGQWNMNKVIQSAPPGQVHNILSTQLQLQNGQPDLAVWNPNTSGQFTVSFAWNCIREKREKTKFNTCTWQKNIPFKCSFLLWRAIRGKLPTNEKLASFGIEPSECHCCHSPGTDTIEHIFNSGNFAKNVWKFFATALGIQTDPLPLRNMIMRWWSLNHNNEAHKLILQSTPIFICWNLWKNRCAKKYGRKQSNMARVKHLVILDTFKLLHTAFPYISWPWEWSKLCTLIEKCTHDIKVTVVQWIKPPDRWTKLNTDGSALSNPGSTGAGGILRNHFGDIIFAFSAPLGEGTNNKAEIEAAIFGLSWCVQLKYKKVILEVDSQLLVDWLMNNTAVPWSISSQVQKLQHLITQFTHFKCIHTLREANFVADSLSKHSHQLTTPQLYFSIQQLPRLATTYLQQDITSMASFRRRKLKRIKEPP
ncbi:uncharacterized protein LOC125863742 [Solanum stenotomum]|uniref:uncharacterized protein LOC125863742 n=1 Tax=Solanum stenotomum TaxID=172797 RepID=UPI0020D0C249|nr:uncharacterized protein LOC125863742 [Solanum stenotomum]